MTIEDKLKGFIVANYGSIKNFADHADMPYQTVVSILHRGVINSSFGNVINICKVLGISIDELSKGSIGDKPIPTGGTRRRDLPTILRQYSYFVNHEGEIMLDDIALNDEERSTVYDSVLLIIELLRRKRRRKLEKDQ